jgi:hypothetical protein
MLRLRRSLRIRTRSCWCRKRGKYTTVFNVRTPESPVSRIHEMRTFTASFLYSDQGWKLDASAGHVFAESGKKQKTGDSTSYCSLARFQSPAIKYSTTIESTPCSVCCSSGSSAFSSALRSASASFLMRAFHKNVCSSVP